jgi:hypothetical protein
MILVISVIADDGQRGRVPAHNPDHLVAPAHDLNIRAQVVPNNAFGYRCGIIAVYAPEHHPV